MKASLLYVRSYHVQLVHSVVIMLFCDDNYHTLAGDTSLAALTGDFLTGEVVGGMREPGKRLAHDPEVASSSSAITCSVKIKIS